MSSVKKLTTRINEVSQALMAARADGDITQIEILEDELYTLEEDLEFTLDEEYADKHSRDFI